MPNIPYETGSPVTEGWYIAIREQQRDWKNPFAEVMYVKNRGTEGRPVLVAMTNKGDFPAEQITHYFAVTRADVMPDSE